MVAPGTRFLSEEGPSDDAKKCYNTSSKLFVLFSFFLSFRLFAAGLSPKLGSFAAAFVLPLLLLFSSLIAAACGQCVVDVELEVLILSFAVLVLLGGLGEQGADLRQGLPPVV